MKRKNLKKKIALFLSVAMLMSFSQAAYAEKADLAQDKSEIISSETDKILPENNDEPTETEGTEKSETDLSDSISSIGEIDISISPVLTLESSIVFNAILTDSNGKSMEKTVEVGNSAESSVKFSGLADGEYTVTITAPGFVDYIQNITIAQKRYIIKLTTGFCEGYSYEKGSIHPGVLLIGDVDNDNKIDEDDKNSLIDAIDSQTTPNDLVTDLNGDGKTDLLDLMFFSQNYKEFKDTAASPEELIASEIIEILIPKNTDVEGDVTGLINGEESVILTPSDGLEISSDNPVSLEFDFLKTGKAADIDGMIIETGSDNSISTGYIDITYIENGKEYSITVPVNADVHYLLKESEVYAEHDAAGNILLHLGSQVAVKKITLTITAMTNNNNLAEISKVEFVNGMENRIPEPEMDIPENLTAEAGSEKFALKWDPCVNVTGYEVKIQQGDKAETKLVTSNSLNVESFGGKEVKNYITYSVSVQSVNGAWRSGFCAPVEVTPKPSSRPDKPDNVSAYGRYKSIVVSWKKMDDTLYYNLFYKLKNSNDKYTKLEEIYDNKYTILELEDLTEYEIYVTGVNELGESPASIHCAAKTTDLEAAEMPKYNLINRDENGIPGSSHILSVSRNGGTMVDSELDEGQSNTAWGAVDNNAASHYSKTTWDDGGYNNIGKNGLTFTFDKAYKLNTIALLPTEGMDYSYAKIKWWAEDGTDKTIAVSIQKQKDSEGRVYYFLKLPSPVTAKKIQIGLARYLATAPYMLVTISEVYFYNYDELRDEIMALYTDNLHTVLKDEVTQKTINNLRKKVNAPDQFGEENPNKAYLLMELETAEKILNDEFLNSSVEIHNGITTNDANRGFSGLNAWQPLGAAAAAGDAVTVYVGHNTKGTGDSTNLQLVASQYHAESNGTAKVIANLKVGANEVTIPALSSSVGFEKGGALYVQYTGKSYNDRYAVRVSGAIETPVLDLYNETDEEIRLNKTVAFIEELKKYTAEIEAIHAEHHDGSKNKNANYSYDNKNCIAGAADIMLDTMMLSLPAQQMLAGAGSGSTKEQAQTVLNSMKAMEDMMYLFYQHKGLNSSATDALNQIPKGHLNIRYQRMFSGAFMYASGNHIGIEWNETKGMMNAVPVSADEEGKYLGGRYFGWGIAHEIGHCINQNSYAVAEITNNYFAQLAQAKDKNDGMRFDYKNIYSKVTSGAKGASSNIKTQLGMYWQLHLAYDNDYNYKTYSEYDKQLQNLFYARVDTYSRNPSIAPAPNNIKLTLSSGDQNLMRLSCAAAEKNVLEFFERWGKTPNEDTVAYAEQFEKETRAIFYVSDDSRVYAKNGKGSVLSKDGSTSAIKSAVIKKNPDIPNKINLTFSPENIPQNDILGYEVIRCTISGGQTEEIPVGFTTGSEFTDTVTTMNNRAVFYKITLIDKYLNRSSSVTTETVKIEHDGSMDKTNWSIKTLGLTAEAVIHESTDEMPCEQTKDDPAEAALDNDIKTAYTPKIDEDNAEIIIEFNQVLTVAGLKYTSGSGNAISDYEIYVSADSQWTLVGKGTFKGSETVYFANDDNKYISTYATSAVKLVLLGQSGKTVSIAELDVLSVTGDNVDFRRTQDDSAAVIGILSKDYKYGEKSDDIIEKGSLIFTGQYKGNPAYNAVLLYDQNGEIVGGTDQDGNTTAQQIILADVPEKGNIANVSNGTWIYWITPDQIKELKTPEKVRAELYRVNNAVTNEGQRMVSDSLFEVFPEKLADITLN